MCSQASLNLCEEAHKMKIHQKTSVQHIDNFKETWYN